MEKINIIEGLLYIAGDQGLTKDELINSVPITEFQLEQAINDYKEPHFEINQYGNQFFLQTSSNMEKYIQRLAKERPASKLSQASLEVLSIIAYNQPVNRHDIEQLRNVTSDGPISTLISKGLIQKKQLEDERMNYFVTTNYFLQVFGLKTIDELPQQKNLDEQVEMDLFFSNIEEDK